MLLGVEGRSRKKRQYPTSSSVSLELRGCYRFSPPNTNVQLEESIHAVAKLHAGSLLFSRYGYLFVLTLNSSMLNCGTWRCKWVVNARRSIPLEKFHTMSTGSRKDRSSYGFACASDWRGELVARARRDETISDSAAPVCRGAARGDAVAGMDAPGAAGDAGVLVGRLHRGGVL